MTRPENLFPGVSILKPLKGADPSLASNLESFFRHSANTPFELLFSVETSDDQAYNIVCSLMHRYPHIRARLFVLEGSGYQNFGSKNPKLKNLNQSFQEAHFDIMLISDSNVRLAAGELDHLLSLLAPQVGMVTSIVSGIEFQGLGGALESIFLGTYYARFMALSNRFAKPCVVGKAMLFRKSDLLRFGGFRLLSDFLAEDFMAGEAMRKLGLQIKTSSMPVLQILGPHCLNAFWKRHLRWGRIRKAHAPLAFWAEPFFNTLLMSICGGWGLSSLHWLPFGAGFLISLTICFGLDGLSYLRMTKTSCSFMLCFPGVWLVREVLALPLWFQIASNNKIEWRGRSFVLARGGILGEK